MAKDYFIIEHEGHIIPDEEMKDWTPNNPDPEYKRFFNSIGYIHRITRSDPEDMAKMVAAMTSGAPRKPQPDATIDIMDAAGLDVAMVVPHWHTLHMNVEHKGTLNDWVIQACEKFPDRLMPGPVFRPSIVGVKETMKEMEYLVTKKGVKYCKIYPPGEKWNMNDERYWPIYSLAQEMGLTIAFHTGHGYVYGANTPAANPRHLEDVCRNFYDLKILAFHMGWPWQDDLNCIAGCYPNLYIGMSFINQMITQRPRFFAKMLGEAIMFAGIDKLIYSNDGLGPGLGMHIEDFRNFQFSEGLQADYGYKALTTDDKAKIFGLNFAKLIGIEPRKRVEGKSKPSPQVVNPNKILKDTQKAYSIDSTVGELLDNAAPRAVIDKHIPEMATNPQIGMARGMPLKMIAGFSGGMITEKILASINEDLKKL